MIDKLLRDYIPNGWKFLKGIRGNHFIWLDKNGDIRVHNLVNVRGNKNALRLLLGKRLGLNNEMDNNLFFSKH